MKVIVYNQKKEKIGETILPKEIFDVPLNQDLVWQVSVAQMSAGRRHIAHTKDRAQVRGGGKKPWRQKGTGRARHGSIRSPLWKGGGVTFGPVPEKVYLRKVTKKMKRKALFMVLSEKARENLIMILDELKIEKPKTKIMAQILEKLLPDKGKILLALPQQEKNIFRATGNISRAKIISAKDLNVLDLLSFKYVLMPKKSVGVIKETFIKV